MGIFFVDCVVINVDHPTKKVKVPKLLVDSGSECTWIPQDLLKKLGVKVFKKEEQFLIQMEKPLQAKWVVLTWRLESSRRSMKSSSLSPEI